MLKALHLTSFYLHQLVEEEKLALGDDSFPPAHRASEWKCLLLPWVCLTKEPVL